MMYAATLYPLTCAMLNQKGENHKGEKGINVLMDQEGGATSGPTE